MSKQNSTRSRESQKRFATRYLTVKQINKDVSDLLTRFKSISPKNQKAVIVEIQSVIAKRRQNQPELAEFWRYVIRQMEAIHYASN